MNIPSDYKIGYESASKVAPEKASNYAAHTLIADPVAEARTHCYVPEFIRASRNTRRG